MSFASFTRRLASSLPAQLLPAPAAPTDGGAQPLAPGPGSSRGPFAAMRHRNYRLFWIGQVLSLVGPWMQSVSEPWLVLLLGGSPGSLRELRDHRSELHRGPDRAGDDQPREAVSRGAFCGERPGPAQPRRGIPLRDANAQRPVAAGAAGRDQHLRPQLPDAAA